MSLITGVGDEEWMASWTIFYWAWWYSWGPFVGMFVARISRGRTIREFMLGVIAAPTGFGFLWFAAVGGTSIDIQETGRADLLAAVAESPQSALFAALDVLPIPLITSVLCVLLMVLFFVSGADAGAITMATMASRGVIGPPKIVVVTMGALMGGVASAMLLAGGLEGLQQAAIFGSGPFIVISMALCWYWVKALRQEGAPPEGGPPEKSGRLEGVGVDRGWPAGSARPGGRAGRRGGAGWRGCTMSRLRRVGAAVALLLAVVVLAACGEVKNTDASEQPAGSKLRLNLATKNFTESFIMGEMYKQALEQNGFNIVIRKNVGGTEVLDEKLRSGEIDAYPEYIGLAASAVAGENVDGQVGRGDEQAGPRASMPRAAWW